MSNKSRLEANNASLRVTLGKVNALPEATSENLDAVLTEQEAKIAELSALLDTKAAGGGGMSVETCTVNITVEDGFDTYNIHYANGVDGEGYYTQNAEGSGNGTHSIQVVLGSVIFFELSFNYRIATCSDGKFLPWSSGICQAYQLPQSSSEPIILSIKF